jgi:hypothetical protein
MSTGTKVILRRGCNIGSRTEDRFYFHIRDAIPEPVLHEDDNVSGNTAVQTVFLQTHRQIEEISYARWHHLPG